MLLEMEAVYGGYGREDIVKGVSCGADSGEILCLMGPNGCGKTTLFRLLLGILPLRRGSIRIDGQELSGLSPGALANLIAYIPQYHTPIFSYTALDVVLMGRASHFGAFESPKPVDREAAFAAMEKLSILQLSNKRYASLSGGQQQLVLIARAICQAAKVFVMDEPAASLDYANQQLLLGLVEDLAKKGYCVVMSTHSPDHPVSIGHKVLMLREGCTAAFGSSAEVITPSHLEEVYGIEMDVVSIQDRHGVRRSICLPVRSPVVPI